MTGNRDAREKVLATAERLFRKQGYTGTGLAQILKESGGPKGSFYFHFPGGKEQLAREVLLSYRARTEAGMRALARRFQGDPDRFVRALCNAEAREMESSNWTIGCAAQNLANELAPGNAEITNLLAETFAAWSSVIADAIEPAYRSRLVANLTATALVAALEGARTLARVMHSSSPFDAVAEQFRLPG